MCLYSIATEYNEPLKAAHEQIDDDRYDMVECGAAGQFTLTLHLSNHLRDCSIASTNNYRMSSANVLV